MDEKFDNATLREEISDYLSNLEKYINISELEDTDAILKMAVIHFQFESIHPFLDGNGRIGRLLIPLYIQSKGMLDKSCLYISDYIEKNKEDYYNSLTEVRTQNDMIGWIKFFLISVIETSKSAKDKFRKVVDFTKQMDKEIIELPVKSENAKKVIDLLYNEPRVTRNRIAEVTGIKLTTINGIVNAFLDKNIIKEMTGYSRNQIFIFERYIDLFLK